MSDTWLTPAEVRELTDRQRWTAQCRVLAAMGMPFRPNAAGRPLVERSMALQRVKEPAKKKPQQPDFSSLQKVA